MIYAKDKLEEFYNQLKKRNINTITVTYSDGDLLKDVNYYLGRLAGDNHVDKINRKIIDLLKEYKTITFKLGGDEYLTFFESTLDAKSFMNKSNKIEIEKDLSYIKFLEIANITTVGKVIQITDINSFFNDINELDLLCSKYKGHKYLALPQEYLTQMCRVSHDKTDINFINEHNLDIINTNLSNIDLENTQKNSLTIKIFNKNIKIIVS